MMYLLLFLQLPVIILMSYFLNRKKIYARSGNIYITSFFEGLGSFLIITSLILGDFVGDLLIQLVLLVIGFTIIAFTKNYINEAEPEIDLQLETMKNLIVLFSSTLLLFYVMLSVFRFQPVFLQFLFALLIVIVFNFVSIFLKRWFSELWDRLDLNNASFVSFSSIYVYIGLFVILLMVIFINFPKVSVNKAFNLSNSNSYFVHPNTTNDLVNRYETDQLFDVDVEIGLDRNAFINQDENHIFIYIHNELSIHDTLIIYSLAQEEVIYSGIYQEEIDGIEISPNNEENNETKFQSDCLEEPDCNEFTYPYTYGDVTYKYFDTIMKLDNLQYEHSDTVIFNENLFHFFEDEEIDSRLSIIKDKPLVGSYESNPLVTDVDNYDGSILYLQVEKNDEIINLEVYQVIEKDVDLALPFYNHYRFGMLVFIFILGLIPITNFDLYRTEIR